MRKYFFTVAYRPLSPTRASRRVALMKPVDFVADCRRLDMPVLLVTGERHLDHVVPVGETLEYRSWIPHAHARIIDRTGHNGVITRARRFAEIVREFVMDLGVSLDRPRSSEPPNHTHARGAAPPQRAR